MWQPARIIAIVKSHYSGKSG